MNELFNKTVLLIVTYLSKKNVYFFNLSQISEKNGDATFKRKLCKYGPWNCWEWRPTGNKLVRTVFSTPDPTDVTI